MKNITVVLLLAFISCQSAQNHELFTHTQKQISKPIWEYVYGDFEKFNTQSPQDFLITVDSLRSIYVQHLSEHKKLISDSLYDQENVAIKLAFDKLLLEYEQHHKNYSGKDVKLPNEALDAIQKNYEIISDARFFKNKDVQAYIEALINTLAQELIERQLFQGQDNQYFSARSLVIDKIISNTEQKRFWSFKILKQHIENIGIRNLEKYVTSFKNSVKDTAMVKQIGELFYQHQEARKNHVIETYKSVDGYDLEAHLFLPKKAWKPTPAIVYFHGGSWSEGKPDWFFESGSSYAKKGWAAIAIEYRIVARHNSLPFESVKDAKSAIRWIRENATRLNINPNQIVVTGNSAGGHLALATTLADDWNEDSDNLNISSAPNAVMVNAAVYDLTVSNSKWIVKDLDKRDLVKQISPNSLIKKTDVKYLLIHGKSDNNCLFETAQHFYDEMRALGNHISLHAIPEAGHFIWFGKHAKEVYPTLSKFLQSLNYQ